MSELFSEIEDDIRHERFEQLWKRYGKVVIGISIAIVLATAGVVMEKNHKQALAVAKTTQFMNGVDRLNAGDYKAAIAAFSALTQNPSSSYYGPAMLRKAQAETASGDKAAAAKTYAALAGHAAEFGELASLMTPDAMPVPDRSSAFYYTESEQKGWQLLKEGKKTEAASIFLSLHNDLDAPFSLRNRMQKILEYLAPDKAAHD